MGDSKRDTARWPLSFQMRATGHRFWSHELYRGPRGQPVRVLYSRTKLESEEIAHEFLGEKVIGFDMEWPQEANTTPNTPLQQRIGLIQIACEEKIALFHIGLHPGSTAKDLLAPALRNIIEDPAIAKCGVAVYNADFARLQKWFGLKPRGAFELSHLHNLVSFGASSPAECTTRLRKLSVLVEQHLGLLLHKGNVRKSNWSQPLDKDQVNYAASDAYAGFALFHCMNAKRMDMDPTPPLPVYVETYGDAVQGMAPKRPLQLMPVHGHLEPTSVLGLYKALREAVEDQLDGPSAEGEAEHEQHYQAADDKKASSSTEGTCGYIRTGRRGKHILFSEAAGVGADVVQQLRDQHAAEQQQRGGSAPPPVTAETKSTSLKARTVGPAVETEILDDNRTEILFLELRKHRWELAKERKCAPFIIAHDELLHAISRKCPRSDVELLRIHGIGKKKLADYGSAWLAIIQDYVEATRAVEDGQQQHSAVRTASQSTTPASHAEPDRSIRSTPALHTGITFSVQNTSLDREKDGEDAADDVHDQDSSDDRSAFGSPLGEPCPSVLKRKRGEVELDREPDPVRPAQPRGRFQAGADEDGKLPPQAAPVVNMTRQPQILSTLDRLNTDAAPLPVQVPHINYEAMITAQGRTRTTTLAAASPPPPAAPNIIPPRRTTTKSDVNLQSAYRQSNASKFQDKILRNKIIAFNKLVTTTVQLPANTIEHLVDKLPRTMLELLQVPGIMPFANACSRANHDLLGFLVKSAATR